MSSVFDKNAIKVEGEPFPELQQPGDHRAHIKITNSSDKLVKVRLQGTINENHIVNAKRTTSLNYNYTLGANEKNISIAIFNRETGEKLTTYRQTITPYRYVNVNTRQGYVEVSGGFDEPQEFDVKVIGVGIEDNDILEETDVGLPAGMSGKLFRGSVSKDPADSRRIKFNAAESVEVESTQKTQFLVNGKNKGRSTSFRYTSLAGGEFFKTPNKKLTSERNYITARPNIHVRAGPSSRVGGLRKRLGLSGAVSNFSSLLERFT